MFKSVFKVQLNKIITDLHIKICKLKEDSEKTLISEPVAGEGLFLVRKMLCAQYKFSPNRDPTQIYNL